MPPARTRVGPARPLLYLEADQAGDLVQLDCFHIGRLTGTAGHVI